MISSAYLNNETRVINEIKSFLKGEYYSPRSVDFVPFPTREFTIKGSFSNFRNQIFSIMILIMYNIILLY